MANSSNHRHIMLRYVIVTGFILVFSVLIVRNLFRTTIVEADEWNKKANTELLRTDTIMPERGDILAADGSVLVTNLCYYNVHIDYGSDAFKKEEYIKNVEALSDSLYKYFPRHSRQEWHDILLEQVSKKKKSRYYPLLKMINYAELQRFRSFPFFNIGNSYKTGLIEVPVMKRDCPYGSMARRSIGRVGQTAECKEIHGISGLEKALDSLLFGKPGVYKRVAFTKGIGNWVDKPALDGYNVTTTIDITLQDILENELNTILDSCQAEWGCAVLMEVATGDIKAISNLERDKHGNYIEAYNRAVVAYEPGSVIKPISMMFALEKGLVNNLDEVIPIGASFGYGGGRPITDSHFNSSLTVAGVIEESSNIGMTRITIRGFDQNPEGFVKCFEDIGFFEKMNSGIFEEETPRMTRKPKRIDMSRMCYGYATAVPPLYTLSVYNAIANDGRYVRPRLVKGISRNGVDSVIPVSYIRDSICSPENAAKLRTMLTRVVEGKHGTGRRLRNEYVKIAGKTGTCYHIDLATGRYDHSRKRLAFCGFFPADAPKYSCMVLTFDPKKNMFGAASTSGEVLKNMALKMYSRGMLGDYSDYHDNVAKNRAQPVINASASGASSSELINALGADNSPRQFSAPKSTDDTLPPSVQNLGIREALVKLEQAGYEVRFTGTGRVRKQELTPGTNVVKLTLSNK